MDKHLAMIPALSYGGFNRRDIRKNQSRNNLVTPDFLVNQIWQQEEEGTSGVKIIELNSSSGSSKEPTAPVNTKNNSHAWSYANNGGFEEDEYTVNEEARRRRRMSVDHSEAFAAAYANQYFYDQGVQSNSFYETYPYDDEYTAPVNHQMNCFTILNNNQNLRSDSSTDNEIYDGVEVIELDNTEGKHWDHVYNDDVVPYEPNVQQETRTIWIYSYKNKRLLSESDYELVNIPSKDVSNTSTSCSISDEEARVDKNVTTSRLGSPIPPTYIPRLNLSIVQTLSTVTEISEPNKCFSKESSHEIINLKPKNNWFTDKNDNNKIENSNVINWLALSPRERRRRSINTESLTSGLQNVREREITYAEGCTQFGLSNESSKIESSSLQVQADVHSNENASRAILSNSPIIKTKLCDNKMNIIIPMNISYADINNEIVDEYIELDHSNKPSIEISTERNKANITGPIEKLDSDNWILEEKVEKETVVYDYDLEKDEEVNTSASNSENVLEDSANTRLWLKNLRLMKPPQWAEYLPITCSPPSLHLSISLSSMNDKKSWFKRFAKCIKCCK